MGAGSGRRQSSTAAMSPAVWSSRPAAAVSRWRSGCSPVSAAKASRCALQGRPRRLAGEFGDDLVGSAVEHLNDLGSKELLGRHMKPVGVALDGVEQPGSWVAEFAQQRGGRGRGLVAGEDLLQHLGRGAGCDGVGSDEGVRVAVADDLQVEVVGEPSAGEHGVQLLPGFLPG